VIVLCSVLKPEQDAIELREYIPLANTSKTCCMHATLGTLVYISADRALSLQQHDCASMI